MDKNLKLQTTTQKCDQFFQNIEVKYLSKLDYYNH
jgi:hypothetical protein